MALPSTMTDVLIIGGSHAGLSAALTLYHAPHATTRPGNCASMMKIIPNAIRMGAYAGAGIARELSKRVTRSH